MIDERQNYPSALNQIDSWSKENQTTTEQARARFMEFVILSCIALYRKTRNSLVLKGGNALRFAYQSPRSTKDLDFTAEMEGIVDSEDEIRALLTSCLKLSNDHFGVKAKCQKVERRPSNPKATKPTFLIKVGYQFPEDRYFNNFEDRNFSTFIPVEISLNDLVCETQEWSAVSGLKVCSLEDIISEKLRSLLQQKIRDRFRWQDVYDICTYVRRGGYEKEKVAIFLKEKCKIRDIEVSKSSFDEDIRNRASMNYEERVKIQVPSNFIPFVDAWDAVISLVTTLDIAE